MDVVDRPLFVVSDAHLGASDPEQEEIKSERLHRMWRQVESDKGDLVILGDLFDFWFEFRHAIPSRHFDHLMALKHLVASGSRVWYVAGNHDFWAGPFFENQIGVQFCPDELELICCGRRVTFAHGDGWRPSERGYRLLKRVLRSRWAIALFRLLSPDLGFPLARFVSNTSRGRHDLDADVLPEYSTIVQQRLEAGADVVVTAHLHAMVHRIWPQGEWLVTGDWINHFSYALINDEGVTLLQWNDSGSPRAFNPETRPDTSQAPGARI